MSKKKAGCKIPNGVRVVAGVATMLYLVISCLVIFVGLANARTDDCYDKRSRGASLFPAYSFGCYLGVSDSEPYNNETYLAEVNRLEKERQEIELNYCNTEIQRLRELLIKERKK